MCYVYILKCLDDRNYVGSCRDLHNRYAQHCRGEVFSTKGKRPLTLVYARKFDTYSDARKEESRIKKWKKRSSINNLIKYDINNLIAAHHYDNDIVMS